MRWLCRQRHNVVLRIQDLLNAESESAAEGGQESAVGASVS